MTFTIAVVCALYMMSTLVVAQPCYMTPTGLFPAVVEQCCMTHTGLYPAVV